jgi:hypothetical protein
MRFFNKIIVILQNQKSYKESKHTKNQKQKTTIHLQLLPPTLVFHM